MDLRTRQALERRVVRKLVREMKSKNWEAIAVNNGEEVITTPLEKDVMEHVFSVDDSHIIFYNKAFEKKHSVFIVLGNDGYDAICDYSYGLTDNFNEVMEAFVDPYVDKLAEQYC